MMRVFGTLISTLQSEILIFLLDDENVAIDDYFLMYQYKTVYCPYPNSHEKHSCVYAHNIQDYRRSPIKNGRIQYQAYECKKWKK